MKAKKAIKRLIKAQSLLSSVSKQFAAAESTVRDLLTAAHNGVDRAKTLIGGGGGTQTIHRATLRLRGGRASSKRTVRRLTEKARKKLSLAAKRRWAAAKRKGMKTLGG